jgi:poly-gamma-glutamate synthesis protein (capsule biosynthesis protein)
MASPVTSHFVLRAVGDIMLIAGAARRLEERGCEYPFGPVAEHIRSADMAFGNLEMPIRPAGPQEPYFPDVCPDFHCPPLTAECLRVTGFHVLNLANNHMMDWGLPALRETITRLRGAGLQTIGAGETLDEARQPAILVCKGLRVGFLGYGVPGPWNATPTQPGTAPIDRRLILDDVHALRGEVDLLVVSLHTGILSDYPNPEDRHLAKELIDNGVDLILGHGPHVLQGIELYRGRPIAFSLGNFIVDMSSGNIAEKVAVQEQVESIILDVTMAPGGPAEVSYLPILITPAFQTVPAGPEDAARIRTKVDTLSRNLEHMQGLALWEHAGALNVEHELRVLAFQARHVGLGRVLGRLKKVRWRHLRLLLGYVVAMVKKPFARRRVGPQQP